MEVEAQEQEVKVATACEDKAEQAAAGEEGMHGGLELLLVARQGTICAQAAQDKRCDRCLTSFAAKLWTGCWLMTIL